MPGSARILPFRRPGAEGTPLEALVEATRGGDRAAANALLRRVAPAMLKAIRGMLGPQSPDVDDVLQDALLRFLRALETYRGECTVLHFAARVGVHAAADSARSHHRRARLTRSYGDESGRERVGLHADRSIAQRQLLAWLLTETLSDVQIDTLVLRNALGYSLEEIAETTSVPVNTVRGRLHQAKLALRARLAEEPELAALFRGVT